MKRIISILTLAALLFSLAFAGPVSAAANPKTDLKQAIEIAKATFNIDSKNYDFNSNYSEAPNGQKLWNLSWNANNPNGGNGINVTIDADTGEIVNMSLWEPYTGPASRIPKHAKSDALKAAEALAMKLQPEKFKQSRLYESTQDRVLRYNYYSDVYSFYFVRQINGIDYQDNGITVNVDKNTLKVKYFGVNWDNSAFPDAKKALPKEQAIRIFEDKLGLELAYYYAYPQSQKDKKPILVYTFKNGSRPIDAFTGELLNNWYGGPMYDKEMMGRGGDAAANEVALTPQEQKVIDDAGSYISKEQAIESLKKFVTVTDSYKLINANLFAGYMNENAAWNFGWDMADKEKNLYSYISGSVDAVTGEVRSFYISDNQMEFGKGETPKYTKEQCKEISDKFLAQFHPEKAKSSEYRDNVYDYMGMPEKPVSHNFNYIRKVNGVSAPFNSLNVTVNTRTGAVMGFNMNWNNMAFPEAKDVISLEQAYKILYTKSDLVLKYIKQYDYRNYNDSTTRLAYLLNDFYGMLDARTGAQIDYNGDPVIETKEVAFSDIKGHAAESDIKLLVEMAILESTEENFRPNDSMLQKDFIKLLMRAIQPVYYPVYMTEKSSEYDNYYNQAIQQRIISEADKKPDAAVTRQEAAKMLVKALGVGFVADLSNIYTISFKDVAAVQPSYKGYIAIASELGLIQAADGCINPVNPVTRGDAASMLIKMMKVDTTQGNESVEVTPIKAELIRMSK